MTVLSKGGSCTPTVILQSLVAHGCGQGQQAVLQQWQQCTRWEPPTMKQAAISTAL